MTNKDRKQEVVTCLIITIFCAIVFWLSVKIDASFTHHNQMEYMMHGGINADPSSMNLISKMHPLWVAAAGGIVFSSLGFVISAIMLIISLINYWVNSTPIVVQQVKETDSQALIRIGKLYKEGLLTKEEFERKKKQLFREK